MKIITKKAKRKRAFVVLLDRFASAVRAHEMRGGGRPEDVPGIERDYETARAAILDYAARNLEPRPGERE